MLTYDSNQVNALIVEDQDLMRHLLIGILKQLGLSQVVDASNGQAALEVMKSFHPDVIFTDYMMEPINGSQLIKKIHAGETPVDRFVPSSWSPPIPRPAKSCRPVTWAPPNSWPSPYRSSWSISAFVPSSNIPACM